MGFLHSPKKLVALKYLLQSLPLGEDEGRPRRLRLMQANRRRYPHDVLIWFQGLV